MFGSIRTRNVMKFAVALALFFSLSLVGTLDANDKDPRAHSWSAHTDQWLIGLLSAAAETQVDPRWFEDRLANGEFDDILTPEMLDELAMELWPYRHEIVQIRSKAQARWWMSHRPDAAAIIFEFLDVLEARWRDSRSNDVSDEAAAFMATYTYQVAARMSGLPVAP